MSAPRFTPALDPLRAAMGRALGGHDFYYHGRTGWMMWRWCESYGPGGDLVAKYRGREQIPHVPGYSDAMWLLGQVAGERAIFVERSMGSKGFVWTVQLGGGLKPFVASSPAMQMAICHVICMDHGEDFNALMKERERLGIR